MSIAVEGLEIEIKQKADGATKAINNLTMSMRHLNDSVRQSFSAITAFNYALQNTKEFAGALAKNLGAVNTKASKTASSIKKAVEETKKEMDVSGGGEASVKKSFGGRIKDSLETAKTSVKEFTEKLKQASSPLKKLMKSLGRIALYRALRTVIKGITDALKYGMENAYQFSKVMGGEFAQTMDRLHSLTSQMKNQFGSAFSELVILAQPVLEKILNWLIDVANTLSQVFARLNGDSQYKRANYISLSWKEATDSAKKYKDMVLGIDELNILNKDNGGSGSGNGSDYSSMFTYEDVGAGIANNFSTLSEIKANIKDVIFKWDDVDVEDVMGKVLVGLGAVTGGIIGFKTGGVGGAIVGTIAGALISLGLQGMIFNNDGTVSENEVGAMLTTACGALVGGIIGFTFLGGTGALLGVSIGATIGLLLSKFNEAKHTGTTTKNTLGKIMIDALYKLAGGFLGFKVSNIQGLFLGISIASYVSFILDKLHDVTQGGDELSKEEIFNLLEPAIFGLLGGVIGLYLVGGTKGFVLGMSMGLQIGLHLEQIIDEGNQIAKSINDWWADLTLQNKLKLVPTYDDDPVGDYLKSIRGYADGGIIPSNGQLFMANEAGSPEMIGAWGSQTAVANTDQIVQGIQQGVTSAVSGVLAPYLAQIANNTRETANKDVSIRIGDREIAQASRRGQRLLGASLIN